MQDTAPHIPTPKKPLKERLLSVPRWMAAHADPVFKWSVVLALAVGGWWVFEDYEGADVVLTNPQMQISVDYLDLPAGDARAGQYKMAVVHVKTRNLGSAAYTVDPDALVLTLSPLQGQLPPGWVDTRNLVAEETVSLLQNHPNGEVLEPGVEYDDQAAFILPVGALYLAQAKLDLGDDFSAAESYVRVR